MSCEEGDYKKAIQNAPQKVLRLETYIVTINRDGICEALEFDAYEDCCEWLREDPDECRDDIVSIILGTKLDWKVETRVTLSIP